MQEKSHNESHLFQRLEKLRLVKQLSWDDLATLLACNRSYFFHVKAGRKSFGRMALYRLEQAEQAAGLIPPPGPRGPELQRLESPPGEVPTVGTAEAPDFQALEARLERVEALLGEVLTLLKAKKK